MKMKQKEIIDRKIILNRQLLGLIKDEIEDLRDRAYILSLKERLEDKLKESGFDSVLSRKLDCIQYLLEH